MRSTQAIRSGMNVFYRRDPHGSVLLARDTCHSKYFRGRTIRLGKNPSPFFEDVYAIHRCGAVTAHSKSATDNIRNEKSSEKHPLWRKASHGPFVPLIIWPVWVCFKFSNRSIFLLTLIINDMKPFYKKIFKSKKSFLGSIRGPGPATSTSTPITSTTDLMPCIPASDTTASAQVTAGVSVSVQLRPSHL